MKTLMSIFCLLGALSVVSVFCAGVAHADLKTACSKNIAKDCPDMDDETAIVECLEPHKSALSKSCQRAIQQAKKDLKKKKGSEASKPSADKTPDVKTPEVRAHEGSDESKD